MTLHMPPTGRIEQCRDGDPAGDEARRRLVLPDVDAAAENAQEHHQDPAESCRHAGRCQHKSLVETARQGEQINQRTMGQMQDLARQK